jgi:peptide/nickel transport system substrate-binding protein
MNTRALSPLAFAAIAFALVACGGERPATSGAGGSAAGGTLVIATPGDADLLLPPLVAGLQGGQIVAQLFDGLADIGDSLNTIGDAGFKPRLATSWRWAPDSLSIAFALDPRARFHDGQPVRAADVKFSYDLTVDPVTGSATAPLLANVDSVSAPDTLTAVVHFKQRAPEQFFAFVYNVVVLPKHLLDTVPRAGLRASAFARNPVGSGRFRFASWRAGEQIEIVADTANWRGRPKLDRVVWSIVSDPAAATAKLLAGEADMWEMLRGDGLTRVAQSASLHTVPYPALDVGYLAFNVTTGPFADRALRRALAAAIDRDALVKSALDTMAYVAAGPAPRAVAAGFVARRTYDAAAATRTLDSLGWRLGADGVRSRGGRPLAFSVLVPSSSQIRGQLAVLLQEQLKHIGARITIESVEPNVFMQRISAHKFEVMLNAWHGDPSPSAIRMSWGAAAARDGGANYSGYASRTFDALVDSAAASFDPAAGQALYARAYGVLAEDAPAVWLYELRNFAGVHRRVHTVGMRADAWWANLAGWSIPPNERIARDQIGLRTAAR